MKKEILVMFLLVFMSLSINAQTGVWTGEKTKWTKGIGTSFDPFIIETPENLAYLADGGSYEGKHFKVTRNLDLNGLNWTPIGAFEDSPFKGYIDFDNHTISGLYVVTERSAGLFGYISSSTICNVTFDSSCSIHGYDLAGMLVGYSESSIISNITNKGTVFSDGYKSSTGGIIGKDSISFIKNSMNCGSVTNIDKSSGSTDPNVYVGGILGQGSISHIQQCCNTGYINGYSVMATAIYSVGGIAGENDGTLEYCYNTGNIQCRLRYVRWYNNGTRAYVAGVLAGEKSGNVHNSYNTGLISGCSYWSGTYACIKCPSKGNIVNCYSTWNIKGCEADSYTSSSENNNGIKVSLEELNTQYIIDKLDEGTGAFIKDEYPYVNNATPVLSTIRQIAIKTDPANNIGIHNATLNGSYFSPGYTIIRKGFVIWEKTSLQKDTFFVKDNFIGIENLKSAKRYQYRFFIQAEDGTIMSGSEEEFVTSTIKTEVYTLETSNINLNSASLKGAIISYGSETINKYGFEYWEEGTLIPSIKYSSNYDGTYFDVNITELQPSTKYEYRCFAEVENEKILGETKVFVTKETTGIQKVFSSDLLVKVKNGFVEIENTSWQKAKITIFNRNGILVKCFYIDNGTEIITLPQGIYIINGNKICI